MSGDRDLALGKAIQKVGLARAILPKQTISSANRELNGAILDEFNTVKTQTEVIDFQISGRRARSKNTSDRALDQAFLSGLGILSRLRCCGTSLLCLLFFGSLGLSGHSSLIVFTSHVLYY
jgi:hypothetical protein